VGTGSIRARWGWHPESVISGHLLSANIEAHRCLAPLWSLLDTNRRGNKSRAGSITKSLCYSQFANNNESFSLLPAVLLFSKDTLIDVLASFFNFELGAPDLIPHMTLAQDLVAPTGCNSTTSPIC
jgi:hypothetical protein